METEPLTANEYPRLELMVGPNNEGPTVFVIPMGQSVIGRLPNSDLRLSSIVISRRVAMLFAEANCVSLSDTGYSAGIFINGARLPTDSKRQLAHSDKIKIGPYLFRYLEHATYWDD